MSLYSGVKRILFTSRWECAKKTSSLQGVADDVADKFIRGMETIKKCNLKDHVAKSLTHKTAGFVTCWNKEAIRKSSIATSSIVINFFINYLSFWWTQTGNFIDTFPEIKCSASESTYQEISASTFHGSPGETVQIIRRFSQVWKGNSQSWSGK